MNSSLIQFFSVIAVMMVLVIAGSSWWAVNRRKKLQLRTVEATQLGWLPAPASPVLIEVATAIYARGRPGVMVAGDHHGRPMHILDYTYTVSSSDSTSTVEVHLVALGLPVALPTLQLRRRSRTSKIFGQPQLELANKAFTEAFKVTCYDDSYALAVLHPRMVEWLMLNPTLEWQIEGDALISWGFGRFVISDVRARLDAMAQLIELIPAAVLQQYGRAA